MVEGVQQAIKGMQALVSVEGLEREVKVGRQNRGFENECCSRENYLVYPQQLSFAMN